MSTDIILIGPIGAGKSTIAELLSARLGRPRYSMDALRWDYYAEIGYDDALARQKRETEGFWALYQYSKPFEAYAVERILADHTDCIIDFGAGHSVYEDDALFKRVQRLLAPYRNIVLLLPSPDLDESIAILNAREPFLREMKPNINEHFIKHHSNHELAKFVVYTEGKTPDESCEEILHLLTA